MRARPEPRPRVRRLPLAAAVLALALALAGARRSRADLPPVPALPAGITPAPVEDVLAITPEMRAWAHREVPVAGSAPERLGALVRRLQATDGAGLVYDPWFTAGATQTFTAKRFNCLAFSHLVVALARELDLPAYYLEARGSARYGREGDLLLLAGHVTVGWGDGPQRWVIEFGDEQHLDPHRFHRIDDRRALALHYTNVGAASLRTGDVPAALAALAAATQVDPGAGAAWVNLGVALRRRGIVDGAEQAYRHAIAVEPEVLPAWANLYALLRATAREKDAARLLDEVAKRPHRDPWLLLAMGDGCVDAGDLRTARRLYEQANDVAPDEAAPRAALAAVAVKSGDDRRALRWLHRAEAIDPHEPRLVAVRKALKVEEQAPPAPVSPPPAAASPSTPASAP